MNGSLFLAIIFLSLLVFFVPRSLKYFYALILLTAAVALTSTWSIKMLSGSVQILDIPLNIPFIQNSLILTVDRLSAFFIIVINITVFIGLLYARGYLEPYYGSKNALRFSIHYFSYIWLYLSMLMVYDKIIII